MSKLKLLLIICVLGGSSAATEKAIKYNTTNPNTRSADTDNAINYSTTTPITRSAATDKALKYSTTTSTTTAQPEYVDDSLLEGGHYHTKYDYVDIDDVYNHARLVHHYVMCLINRGPCPPETADLKRVLGEILQTSCKLCTQNQVHIIDVSIKRIRAEHPFLWKKLIKIYDPEDIYVKKFEEDHDPKPAPAGNQKNELAKRSSP